MTNTETKLISINAALAGRAERLRIAADISTRGKAQGATYAERCAANPATIEVDALRAQIRDLETEKRALLQEMPL
jgi:hypothetical protein